MMDIKKITDRIAAEAQSEIDAVLGRGKAQADKIRADFEAKARNTYDELLRTGTDEVEQDVQRQGRNARLEARKAILSLKQEMIAAALTGREEIVLNDSDRKKVGEKVVAAANALAVKRGLPGELKLSANTRPIRGGLVLRQGDIEVNCTLDSLLALSRGSLDAEVADILFR